ncbi:saccharopine dehydrogenase family protein [Aliiroseovarius sp. YM-037]|uniref:saccharopine dehydrogenase family protein n=1 Tax=Aliiroseovarius sp. YM-037 TaxID=3341728 RepID=UPI003A7F89E2
MTIHWCGTGLSAIPGLRRLIEAGEDVEVWNRTVETAQDAVGDLTDWIEPFTADGLNDALSAGDVIVSMLSGDFHVPLARLAIARGAHFVSSSYISPEMRALDQAARDAGVVLMNEVGLDPGIDHLMAHWLVADYRGLSSYRADNAITFRSYCGGVPKIPNAFRYKFSWSPLGVLKALKSPSRSIRDYTQMDIARPWDAISSYAAPIDPPETFEVYPNRDSLPFMAEYGFGDEWQVKEFVRGTLRLNGWADAWQDVFAEIETLDGEGGDTRLREMSDAFWRDNAYDEDDPDRVIMCVELKAEADGTAVYHKTYAMDAWGDARGTAMARLVSVPVSLAVKAVMDREIAVGVHAAPSDPRLVAKWLGEVDVLAQHLRVVDHLSES